MQQVSRTGAYRWRVIVLLFFATTINYLDWQLIGLLKPTLETEFSWQESDYSRIVMAFSASYAVGLLLFGRFIDRIGAKLGYSLSIIIWSLAALLHAVVRQTTGFVLVRSLLGLGEAGNVPAAIKTVAEWFPRRERALATGLVNAGANMGAVVAPIVVPWLLGAYGWQAAFLITGAIGFVWLLFWWFSYEVPAYQPRLSKAELACIRSDSNTGISDGPAIGWGQLLLLRQTWAFIVGKLLTDPIWWFFLFWLPSYFATTFELDLKKPSLPLVVVYTATTIGSIGGGYLSGYLIQKGWSVFRARKTAMLLFAACVLPVVLAQFTSTIWEAVGLISLAAAAHQAWSATLFTTVSDTFPRRAIGSVVGIGGMAGSVGGLLFPLLVGTLLDQYKAAGNLTGGYNLLFVICGCTYLVAWCLMHLLSTRQSVPTPTARESVTA